MALAVPPSLLGTRVSGDVAGYTLYTDKNGAPVIFPRHPPKVPRSILQAKQRTRFAIAVTRWHEAPAIVREAYEAMSLKLSLPMTGLNVWMKLSLTQDEGLRQTLERQSALSLPMPPNPYAEVP